MILGDIPSLILSALAVLTIVTTSASAATLSPQELVVGKQWTTAHLGSRTAAFPFSFVYDGKSSSELLAQWEFKSGNRRLDEMRTEHILTWSDPQSRITFRCVVIEYDDFPAAEWTLYFKNEGNERSPLLKDIQALDAQLERELA